MRVSAIAFAPSMMSASQLPRWSGTRPRSPGRCSRWNCGEKLQQESPFGDGLSFGQASEAGRPFLSDRFETNLETREPYDGVQFYDSVVEPGETVVLNFVITDTTPRFKFYLMQSATTISCARRRRKIASRPTQDKN